MGPTARPATRSGRVLVPRLAPALAPVLIVVLTVTLVAGCGRVTRPEAAEWTDRWNAVQELVPDQSTLSQRPSNELCDEVVVDLREAGPDLTPGPDEVVDGAATAWLRAAESTFFECFDPDAGADDVDTAYDRLDQLVAEVDTALRRATP